MRLPTILLAVLLMGGALAGCAGKKADQPTSKDFNDLGLQATSSTGVLRGVVVDSAIRPVVGAAVTVTGPSGGNTTSTKDGLFGFDGLAPGDYFIHVAKAGFAPAQQSASVVAGVQDPPVLKVLLTPDKSTAPYVSTYVFDGFIQCSFSLVAVGFAACSSASSDDKFITNYTLDKTPQWAQSEMFWDSTQAVSPGLDVVYSAQGNSTLLDNYEEDRGTSPLLLQANETVAVARGLGAGTDLLIRVFNEPVDGTRPPDPVHGDDCLDRPQLGGCATGAGMTVNQKFTIITNVFYGVVPDPSWRYATDGPYVIPA